MNLDDYEQHILSTWEEVYKKGLLTFWILLALKDGAKHMSQIKSFTSTRTNHNISADDQSLYRSLRRLAKMDLLAHTSRSGKGGPELKVYTLTTTGQKVLQAFAERNITGTYYQPAIKSLIERKYHE